MINRFIILCSILFGLHAAAQQVPLYNHFMMNPFVYNPSMAGFSGDVNTFFVRNQRFMGFDGGAINNHLSVEGASPNQKFGFGLMVSHQSSGLFTQLSAGATLAYNLRLAESHYLRFGVTAGYLDNWFDSQSINVSQIDDPYIQGLSRNKAVFDLNAGLTYHWNGLRVGVAVPQLVGGNVQLANTNDRGYYRLAQHIMGSAEYEFTFLDEEKLRLRPIALVRYVPNARFQYDAGVHLDYMPLGWVGVFYKSNYAVQFNLGFRLFDKLMVGYSYEWVISNLNNYYTGMNHEFMVGFKFGKKQKDIAPVLVDDKKLKLENQILKNEIEELKQEVNRLQREQEKADSLKKLFEDKMRRELDSLKQLANQPKEVEPPKTVVSKGYNLHEMDGTIAPNGYYVVGGVFSKRENADNILERCKENDLNDARIVVNKNNNLFYVIVSYNTSKADADKVYTKYVNAEIGKAWVLNYIRP